ncbi:hypothetical protein [Streptomyces sp. SAJ15]|uniref:hypothetical protein n=1 Tax=Streptomyces sp. SAJ15 TaxID=2011095 RepID=UPI0011851735|nr:hypothetical protein [Streptomyces sp. SAJ15]TVL91264.1 hypothetical protein CD790_18630 [Streptomyces sp. SAJ15]
MPALTRLRQQGFALFALTDCLGSSVPDPEPAAFRELLDGVFSSAGTGAIKPERQAFAAVEVALGARPQDVPHGGDPAAPTWWARR